MRHILWLLQTLCTTKKALLKELGLLFVSELLAFRFFSLKCNFSVFFNVGNVIVKSATACKTFVELIFLQFLLLFLLLQ